MYASPALGAADAPRHVPVLLHEVLSLLELQPNDDVIDGTLGAGGHAEAMLAAIAPKGRLLGFELDEAAYGSARKRLAPFGSRAMLVRESYANAAESAAALRFGSARAALLDLGTSSMELDDASRGFSFRADGPLDMRFDRSQDVTAAYLVNSSPLDELSRIIAQYGEERFARRIAEAIVRSRRAKSIVGTQQLVDIIAGAVPASYRRGRIHFATRTFQALRIATNDELGNIERGVEALFGLLAPGGRLAVISFHSLEDRIVKQFAKACAQQKTGLIITKKPAVPTDAECHANPRARSAKLRVIEKI